jgi:hypothetical protein
MTRFLYKLIVKRFERSYNRDFNAETITSLKLNLFSFFICNCQHQRKTICLYVYFSDIRQIVGYRTPVFIQWFPWRLQVFVVYIDTGSSVPISPSESRDLADENNKILTKWK